MRLGMLVRDDNGGLGNLTYDAFSNLRPDVTVIVQSRPCRGEPRPHLFEEAWTETICVENPITDTQWETIAPKADIWWTAETWYNDNAESIIKKAGAKTVLYAMPELFSGSSADQIWNPTQYLQNRLPLNSKVVPWPTSPPENWFPKTKVSKILHISGGAQYDRNGTEIFLDSLQYVEGECEIILHQPDGKNLTTNLHRRKFAKGIKINHSTDYEKSLNSYMRWADALVLPRRYAGLCLPAFEAFGYGCLVAMPEVDPQAFWPIIGFQAIKERPRLMKGGKIPMWNMEPFVLAKQINVMLEWDVPTVVRLSEEGRTWAEKNSWENLLETWKTAFQNV